MALIKPWLQFKFGVRENYTPAALSRFAESDIEKEYNRLRRAAIGRLKTIGKSEFSESDIYKENKNLYGMTAKQIMREGGRSLLKYRLSAIYRFLSKKTSSVTGLREISNKTLAALHEHGYDFITADNLDDFGRFMDAVRVTAEAMLYDSERVAELFEWGKKNAVPVRLIFIICKSPPLSGLFSSPTPEWTHLHTVLPRR